MITYLRTQTDNIYRYRKTTSSGKILFLKPDRVPAEVFNKMAEFDVDKVNYEEHPEESRCLFCEGYKEHTRILGEAMVALCSVHYYSKNIGQIAAELRSKGSQNGILIEESKASSKKGKSRTAKS